MSKKAIQEKKKKKQKEKLSTREIGGMGMHSPYYERRREALRQK
ncbi:TPA: hypothetical protein ACG05V_005807 [Bacillus pacificus]